MFKQCQQHLCRRSLSPSLFSSSSSSSSSSNAASCTCACVDTYAHASRTKRNGREKREKETQPRTKQRVLVASLDDSDDFDSLRLFSLAALSPSLVFSRYFRFPPIYTRSQFNDRFNLLRALCNDFHFDGCVLEARIERRNYNYRPILFRSPCPLPLFARSYVYVCHYTPSLYACRARTQHTRVRTTHTQHTERRSEVRVSVST